MNATLDPTARYAPHAQAIESRLGDETVILHLERGTYFGLDVVGTIVWERLQAGDTPEDIAAHVRASFDEVPESVENDITTFLEALLENQLIERR
ncbi:MAG: PqqD family protein [Erythrobacter sp.]|nr:PqqD family protein [Erythrobacter sp.]